MSFVALILGLAYIGITVWLTLRILRMFLGPLAETMKANVPTQFFVSDYYVLLAQIAVFTLPFAGGVKVELNPVLLPIIIALIGISWFVATRTLSKARIQTFGPRLLGQILFPFQVAFAAGYGLFAIPLAVGTLMGAIPVAFGGGIAFLFLYALFSKASLLIARQADPPENPNHSPNSSNDPNVPPAA